MVSSLATSCVKTNNTELGEVYTEHGQDLLQLLYPEDEDEGGF